MLPLLLACALLLPAGCGIFGGGGAAPPGEAKPALLAFTATDSLNNCGGDLANALAVRLYQLNANSAASAVPQSRLWEADEEELGEDLLHRRELFLNPGTEQTYEIAARPGARYLMVAGHFCETEGDCWRWIGPMPEPGETIRLRFGAQCIETGVAGSGTGE